MAYSSLSVSEMSFVCIWAAISSTTWGSSLNLRVAIFFTADTLSWSCLRLISFSLFQIISWSSDVLYHTVGGFWSWASFLGNRVFDVGEFGSGGGLDVGEFWTWASFGRGRVSDVGEFRTWANFGRGRVSKLASLAVVMFGILKDFDVGEF